MILILRKPGNFTYYTGIALLFTGGFSLFAGTLDPFQNVTTEITRFTRERISINKDWRFLRPA